MITGNQNVTKTTAAGSNVPTTITTDWLAVDDTKGGGDLSSPSLSEEANGSGSNKVHTNSSLG